jgi:hypothetical protein
MKTTLVFAALLIAAQGCQPERQTPVTTAPPLVAPSAAPAVSAAPAAPAASAPSSDERALQTLRDLGVTPEIMLQLVRNQLAAAAKPDALDQSVPEPIAEATPPATPPLAAPAPATPAPVAQTPAPTVPSPAPAAPAPAAPAPEAAPAAAAPKPDLDEDDVPF